MRPLFFLAGAAAAVSAWLPAQSTIASEVLAASHAGTQAIYHSDLGLIVRAPGAAQDLQLGTAGEARFGAQGALFFIRTQEQGHEETSRTLWTLPAGQTTPHIVRADATVPAYLPPVPQGSRRVAVKFALDAGHGGSDPGALGNGLRETDINLDVCLRLQSLMQLDTQTPSMGGEWDLLMTRTSDTFVSLTQRASAANAFSATTFMSVHMNSFSAASANGTETFCFTGQSGNTGGAFRNRLQVEALAAWGLTDRGVKEANFSVLRNTAMPAALVEGGFITNANNAAVMGNPTQRQTLALRLLYAIQEHHGFSRWDPSGGGNPTGRIRGLVFDAALGSTARIAGATVALADGRFTTSDASGYFEFNLPSGSYDYAGTAPNFAALDLTRTVVAGADIWGSLAMNGAVGPTLTLSSTTVNGGSNFSATLTAAPNSFALGLLNLTPGVPIVDLGQFGLGKAWPNLNGAVTIGLNSVGGSGSSSTAITAPAFPGVALHLQALLVNGGGIALSNGAAVAIQ